MAVKFSTTAAAVDNGIKLLVHAPSGAGKTRLCATAEKPLIISKEGGLLSLAGHDIPTMEVETLEDVQEAFRFVRDSEESKAFDWICVDSLSDIAETVLRTAKHGAADPRQAYGGMAEQMAEVIVGFRDLRGRNVYMSCKQEHDKVENGMTLYVPMIPGRILKQGLAYYFDEVFALHVGNDAEGNVVRALQTGRNASHEAKDRSGALAMWEPADLNGVAKKIRDHAAALRAQMKVSQ